LVAVVFGFLTYNGDIKPVDIIWQSWLPNGIIIGFFFIAIFFLFALSAQKAGVAITAVSSKMSVVLPVIVGVVILKNDHLTFLKVTGIIFALVAFYLTFKKKEKIDINKKYFFLPILLFFGNGTNDSLMSYTEFMHNINQAANVTMLLNVIFSTALIIGLTVVVFLILFKNEKIKLKNIIAGIFLGLFNFASTYYFFNSLDRYPNSVFFPIFNTGIVSLSALAGYFIFKEKLKTINWIGIFVAICAIMLIAISD
jgi:drug/metabolite transporter (DMT)-like permease